MNYNGFDDKEFVLWSQPKAFIICQHHHVLSKGEACVTQLFYRYINILEGVCNYEYA